MLNFVRFLRVLIIVFISIFGAFKIAPAVACTDDEITLTDGTCKPVQFMMTVAPTDDEDYFDFEFDFTAAGTMYIDWGDGSAVQPISTNNANNFRNVSHRFYEQKTIRLSGEFTAYAKKTSYTYATISLYGNTHLVGISGSLGALFPTIGNGSSNESKPFFYRSFKNCTNLKGPIPPELFNGISGTARQYMFNEMFSGCSKLNGYIPYNLFDGITQISSSNMNYIFNSPISLDTTCPPGTTQLSTGYESMWNSHCM